MRPCLLSDVHAQVKKMIEVGKEIEENDDSRNDHYYTRTDFNLLYMRFEPLEQPAQLIEP